MAETKSLADIASAQTSAAVGDLLFIEKGGVPAKITYADLMDNPYSLSGTVTVTGTINMTGGTLTLADNQITGAKVAAATTTTRGTVELATTTEVATATDDTRAVTPLGFKSGIDAYVMGFDQEWSNPTRAVNTEYENTTPQPILVAITVSGAGAAALMMVKKPAGSWITIGRSGSQASAGTCSFVVPPGHFYQVAGSVVVDVWAELR